MRRTFSSRSPLSPGTPKLEVYQEADSIAPYADITGPMCFGGCSELCCDSKFLYKKRGDGKNIAHMKKLAPKTCMDACAEMFTDADKFLVEFGDDVSHEEKANAVAVSVGRRSPATHARPLTFLLPPGDVPHRLHVFREGQRHVLVPRQLHPGQVHVLPRVLLRLPVSVHGGRGPEQGVRRRGSRVSRVNR